MIPRLRGSIVDRILLHPVLKNHLQPVAGDLPHLAVGGLPRSTRVGSLLHPVIGSLRNLVDNLPNPIFGSLDRLLV